MTLRAAIATGNLTAAGTWGVVDATSWSNSESLAVLLTTAYTASAGATTGVITADGIFAKLANRVASPTGTLSGHLAIAGVEVAGTLVTINCADLPVASTADLNGGWFFLKFAAPVVLAGATSYTREFKTSNASQVTLFAASGTLYAGGIRTTTTGALAATDDWIGCSELTGAGTRNTFVVTQDNTATTIFGAAATSLVTPAIAICDGFTLQSGVAAATAYLVKLKGNIVVYAGGTLNGGTSGTPVPLGSSSWIEFDCATNVEYGLVRRNLGTVVFWGTKGFTASPSNHYTLLTADEAATETVIGSVGDTTGWAIGDELVFSPTTRTFTDAESKFISTVGAGTVTLTAGLTNAHSGTNDANGDIRCETGNLTRNVGIRGASGSLQTYLVSEATGDMTLRYAEFKWMGSAVTAKRGFNVNTTTGTFDMQFCSQHDFVVTSSCGIFTAVTTGSGITFSNNVTYNINANHFVNVATSGVQTVSGNMMCKNVGTTPILNIADVGGVVTNNMISGSASNGLAVSENAGTIGTMSGNVVHSCANAGVVISGGVNGTISSLRTWRHTTSSNHAGNINLDGQSSQSSGPLVFDGLISFGASSRNVGISGGVVRLISPLIYAGTTLTATTGISLGAAASSSTVVPGNVCLVEIENGLIGTVSTHSAGDIVVAGTGVGARVVMHNTTLGSATEVSTPANLGYGAFILSLKHDGVVGAHNTWKGAGRSSGGASLESDTVQFHTASPSLRMYNGSATVKLESSTWEVPVASGVNTTASVRIRTSTTGSGDAATYNGSVLPRLMVRRNVAAGIAADTQIEILSGSEATAAAGAANGAWGLLRGSLAGAGITTTDDAILEFYVDCEGTAGFIGCDDFECVGSNPNGMKYWSAQHAGPLALGLPANAFINSRRNTLIGR